MADQLSQQVQATARIQKPTLEDTAHDSVNELFTVLAVLGAARDRHDPGVPESRLIDVAEQKVKAVIKALTPFI